MLNVTTSGQDCTPIVLSNVLKLENNLVGVPLAVLNTRAANTKQPIVYEWEAGGVISSYRMESSDHSNLPQLEHAEYLLTALAMYAQSPNSSGCLAFRLHDIALNAGRAVGSGPDQAIKEMIWRYTHCQVRWQQAWKVKGTEQRQTWHGPLIISEDIFQAGGRTIRRNPGNSRKEKDWHHITFHPMLVQSLESKSFRIFLTEVLQSDLSTSAKCCYRYFFGFGDSTIIYRTFETLMSAFPWRSGKTRFIVWLTSQLEELRGYGVVDSYEINDWGASVRCVPIKTIRDKQSTSLPSARGVSLFKDFDEEDDGQILKKFAKDRDNGLFDGKESLLKIIDEVVSRGRKTDYEPAIRRLYK